MKYFIFTLYIAILLSCSYSQTGWIQLNSGTGYNLHSVFFINADTGIAVGDYGAVCQTSDGGANWQTTTLSVDYTLNSVFFVDYRIGFIVGTYTNLSENDAILLTTVDGGNSWSANVYIDMEGDIFLNSVSFSNQNDGYAVGYTIDYTNNQINPVVYTTVNAGGSWDEHNPNITAIMRGVYFTNSNTGYAVGTAGNILKSINGGASWTMQTSGVTIPFNSVYFTSFDTGYAAGDLGRIMKTINGGNNWVTVYNELPNNIKSIIFLKTNPNVGYVAVTYGGIRRTTDAGISWVNQVSGTQYNMNSICFVDSLNGYASGNYGLILKTTTAGLVPVEPTGTALPKNFALKQNYPNPFNPSTTIEYDLPKTNKVKLVIVDLLGKEIATLVNEKQNAGTYNVVWDASRFPSGVYFYKLEAGDFVQAKRMVLIK